VLKQDPLQPLSAVAEASGLSYNALRDAIERGQLSAWRRGAHGWHYVRKSEVERFMQAGIVQPTKGGNHDAA